MNKNIASIVSYTGGLIALYLIVANGTNFGKVVREGASGGSTLIKTLQGR
ncbi:hypothetical protein QE364_003908 [Nocardioides zeae]|uniref:Uncharacterized protein n=1 Tax=Nocardioides zeae TaxID=1457234 RepID=A0ACC6IN43_9ACTN|nr:hypothetical protein [Nocardioides zeae]MDR6212177.1 hypothetical protein [Nocardioides zeae]